MGIVLGFVGGVIVWFIARYLVAGIYTIDQNERAVLTSFGRAQRLGDATTLDAPVSDSLAKDERQRYNYPQVRVVQPGFYWKWPWQQVHKVSIATSTTNSHDYRTTSIGAFKCHNGSYLEQHSFDSLHRAQ